MIYSVELYARQTGKFRENYFELARIDWVFWLGGRKQPLLGLLRTHILELHRILAA
jgi:hypothetical protein